MAIAKAQEKWRKMENKMLSQDELTTKAPLTMPNLAYPPPNRRPRTQRRGGQAVDRELALLLSPEPIKMARLVLISISHIKF